MFDGLFEFCQLSGGGSVGEFSLFELSSERHAASFSNNVSNLLNST